MSLYGFNATQRRLYARQAGGTLKPIGDYCPVHQEEFIPEIGCSGCNETQRRLNMANAAAALRRDESTTEAVAQAARRQDDRVLTAPAPRAEESETPFSIALAFALGLTIFVAFLWVCGWLDW